MVEIETSNKLQPTKLNYPLFEDIGASLMENNVIFFISKVCDSINSDKRDYINPA